MKWLSTVERYILLSLQRETKKDDKSQKGAKLIPSFPCYIAPKACLTRERETSQNTSPGSVNSLFLTQ